MKWHRIGKKTTTENIVYGKEFSEINGFKYCAFRTSLSNMSLTQILNGERAKHRYGRTCEPDFTRGESQELSLYGWCDERFIFRTTGSNVFKSGIGYKFSKVCFACIFQRMFADRGWENDKKIIKNFGLVYEIYKVHMKNLWFYRDYEALLIHKPDVEIKVPDCYTKVEEG